MPYDFGQFLQISHKLLHFHTYRGFHRHSSWAAVRNKIEQGLEKGAKGRDPVGRYFAIEHSGEERGV
jgi:hypothetical protein